MRAAAFGLAFASALLHATWNLLVKRSGDRFLASWAVATASGVLSLPVLATVGMPPSSTWPYVAASAVIHVGYGSALAAAYERADLSVAYPLARGISPVLVGAGGVVLLDDRLDALGWAGIAATTAGLLFVALRTFDRRGLEWAVVTGLIITVYTLVDSAGVRRGDDSLGYVTALFVAHAAAFTITALAVRGRAAMRAVLAAEGGRLAFGGACGMAAYALVLAATLIAPVGGVSAVRETSVVFGALGGWLLLGEDFGAQRTLGAAVVALGVVLLAVT